MAVFLNPLTPHLYKVKLGFTGVYIFFFIFALKLILWVHVRRLNEAILTYTHNICFEQKYKNSKNIN